MSKYVPSVKLPGINQSFSNFSAPKDQIHTPYIQNTDGRTQEIDALINALIVNIKKSMINRTPQTQSDFINILINAPKTLSFQNRDLFRAHIFTEQQINDYFNAPNDPKSIPLKMQMAILKDLLVESRQFKRVLAGKERAVHSKISYFIETEPYDSDSFNAESLVRRITPTKDM